MGSRIRENPPCIFDCYFEVTHPSTPLEEPWISRKFPENYGDEELVKSIPQFAFPCKVDNNGVQHFSFVLTNHDSKWTFGFCRQAPLASSPICMVLLSYLPWHETFYRILNHLAELAYREEPSLQAAFLETLYQTKVPEPGLELRFTYHKDMKEFSIQCPDHHRVPSIPENRNLTEYFNAVDPHNMMIIFASMLHERRILITSKKLSRLSACVQAANMLIYPMFWQHIFIPVLPLHLLDYLSAPMPFLIGVPASTLEKVKRSELGDVVILDADTNMVESLFNDLDNLPTDVVVFLKKFFKQPLNGALGDGLSRAFLKAIVLLIGGYWNALSLKSGEKITFNPEAFIQSRPLPMQPFLHKMLQLQIFQQFIEERVRQLNSGHGFSDEFECEVILYEGKKNSWFRAQYKDWLSAMKKESGAFFKNMKSKVRDTGKQAYRDIRSRLQDIQHHKMGPEWALARRASHPLEPSQRHTKVISYIKPTLLNNSAESDTSLEECPPNQNDLNSLKPRLKLETKPKPPPRGRRRDTKPIEERDLIQLDANLSTSECSVSDPLLFVPHLKENRPLPSPEPSRLKYEDFAILLEEEDLHVNSTNPFVNHSLTHTQSEPSFTSPTNPFANWQTFH